MAYSSMEQLRTVLTLGNVKNLVVKAWTSLDTPFSPNVVVVAIVANTNTARD